jgi:hypothetical protein
LASSSTDLLKAECHMRLQEPIRIDQIGVMTSVMILVLQHLEFS